MTTITTSPDHGLRLNDRISMTLDVPDRRWWRRAWFWITRRGKPTRKEVRYFRVTEVMTSTTLEIRP